MSYRVGQKGNLHEIWKAEVKQLPVYSQSLCVERQEAADLEGPAGASVFLFFPDLHSAPLLSCRSSDQEHVPAPTHPSAMG